MPDFGLAASPSFSQAALSGYQAGSALGQRKRLDAALGGVDLTRPETIMPVLQADPQTGATLLNAASTMAQAHASAASRVALGNLILSSKPGGGDPSSTASASAPALPQSGSTPPIAGDPGQPVAPVAGAQPGDIVVTGPHQIPAPQASPWTDEERAAITADPEAFLKVQGNFAKMDDRHKAAVADAADAQGAVAVEAAKLPYEQRRAFIQQQSAYLMQHGVTADQIAAFDPTDANIGVQQTQALGVKAALAEQDKARDDRRADAAQAETVHQHGVENGLSQQRIGLEGANVGIARAHLTLAQHADARAATAATTKATAATPTGHYEYRVVNGVTQKRLVK